jgi:hypothetical protein
VNNHERGTTCHTVNIDDIIDYAVNNHERGTTDPDDILKESDLENTLLAHMAGRTSSSGDKSLLQFKSQIRVRIKK